MYRETFAHKNIFGTVPKKCIKTYNKITQIKCMLEKLYGYTPEEAKDYTKLILEGICDEAVQANIEFELRLLKNSLKENKNGYKGCY